MVADSDVSHYFGEQPGIVLEKTTNGEDADDAPGPFVAAGSTVVWRYTMTNTGNVPLRYEQRRPRPRMPPHPRHHAYDVAHLLRTGHGTAGAVREHRHGRRDGSLGGDRVDL
jgi:hypothetical protein